MAAATCTAPVVVVRARHARSVGLEVTDTPLAGPDDIPSPVRTAAGRIRFLAGETGGGLVGSAPDQPVPLGSEALCALVRLGHIDDIRGPNRDDVGIAIAAHDRGDDDDALLTFANHAAGFQPGTVVARV